MNWKEYLRTQGYTDAEITSMATSFGEDKMSRAFADPISKLEAANTALQEATRKDEEFRTFYEQEVTPKISSVYQDAINMRTQNAALTERLKAAQEYGFLNDPAQTGVPGSPPNPGQPVVPGSGAASVVTPPGSPAPPAFDPRYASADDFKRGIDNIPVMLGRLTKLSNEHQVLFGSPLLDIDEIIATAQGSKGKLNVQQVWEQKYKVPEKRAEIQKAKEAAHDKEVADAAVRKYASEHNMPFTAPGVTSRAPMFAAQSQDAAHQPWKGAKDRKEERRQKFLQSMMGGTAARVQ